MAIEIESVGDDPQPCRLGQKGFLRRQQRGIEIAAAKRFVTAIVKTEIDEFKILLADRTANGAKAPASSCPPSGAAG